MIYLDLGIRAGDSNEVLALRIEQTGGRRIQIAGDDRPEGQGCEGLGDGPGFEPGMATARS